MAPTAKRLLPPRSARGARSITVTEAPCSRAASAAARPASPPPTTSTSGLVILAPRLVDGNLPVRTPSWLLLTFVRLPAGFFHRYATVVVFVRDEQNARGPACCSYHRDGDHRHRRDSGRPDSS